MTLKEKINLLMGEGLLHFVRYDNSDAGATIQAELRKPCGPRVCATATISRILLEGWQRSEAELIERNYNYLGERVIRIAEEGPRQYTNDWRIG